MTTTINNEIENDKTIRDLLNLFERQDKMNQAQQKINEDLINLMKQITRDLFK